MEFMKKKKFNTKQAKPPVQKQTVELDSLLGYKVSLIFRDLKKSLIVTVLFVAALVAIFLYT